MLSLEEEQLGQEMEAAGLIEQLGVFNQHVKTLKQHVSTDTPCETQVDDMSAEMLVSRMESMIQTVQNYFVLFAEKFTSTSEHTGSLKLERNTRHVLENFLFFLLADYNRLALQLLTLRAANKKKIDECLEKIVLQRRLCYVDGLMPPDIKIRCIYKWLCSVAASEKSMATSAEAAAQLIMEIIPVLENLLDDSKSDVSVFESVMHSCKSQAVGNRVYYLGLKGFLDQFLSVPARLLNLCHQWRYTDQCETLSRRCRALTLSVFIDTLCDSYLQLCNHRLSHHSGFEELGESSIVFVSKLVRIGKQDILVKSLLRHFIYQRAEICTSDYLLYLDQFVEHVFMVLYNSPAECARFLSQFLAQCGNLTRAGFDNFFHEPGLKQLCEALPLVKFLSEITSALVSCELVSSNLPRMLVHWKLDLLVRLNVLDSFLSTSSSMARKKEVLDALESEWGTEAFTEEWPLQQQSELTYLLHHGISRSCADLSTEGTALARALFIRLFDKLPRFLNNMSPVTRINGLVIGELVSRKMRTTSEEELLRFEELTTYIAAGRFPQHSFHYLHEYCEVYYYRTKNGVGSGLIEEEEKYANPASASNPRHGEQLVGSRQKKTYNPWHDDSDHDSSGSISSYYSDSDDEVEIPSKESLTSTALHRYNRTVNSKQLKYLNTYIAALEEDSKDADLFLLAMTTLNDRLLKDPMELNLYARPLAEVLLALGNRFGTDDTTLRAQRGACLTTLLCKRPALVIDLLHQTFFSTECNLDVKSLVLDTVYYASWDMSSVDLPLENVLKTEPGTLFKSSCSYT